MSENWKLSPSDLTFLWDECKRCFYLKVRHNFRRPAAPFPKIFNTIDLLMKSVYLDQPTKLISPELPDGKVILSGRRVTSAPYNTGARQNTVAISGNFDTLVKFEDGTYGIVDFKTTRPAAGHLAFYSRQLHAYAYALENPAPGKLHFQPIERLGLLCFDPTRMHAEGPAALNLTGPATWVECPLDKDGFLNFLEEVLAVLNQPQVPDVNPDCPFCAYRESTRTTGF